MAEPRIRILHVVFSLEPGGMENGVVNVARGLERGRFDVHVCCLDRSGVFAQRLPDPRNVHVLSRPPGFSWRTILRLKRLLRQIQPDVIHTHNLGPLIYTVGATLFGSTHRLLHGEHGLLPAEQRTWKRLLQRRLSYRCCRKVHTVSEELTRQLIELKLPSRSLLTIPNGVDTRRFQPGSREEARREIGNSFEGAFVLGAVGRFAGSKRHTAMLDAFNRLAARMPNLHFLIVGVGGPWEDAVRSQAAASPAAARIHFAGFQMEPVGFYQAMDLLVSASNEEGMSNVMLEAMACGLPVLSNRACGSGEVITHGVDGLVADLGSVEKLETELAAAIACPDRLRQIGAAARKSVVKRFSILNMVRQYDRVYRQLAAR